ncbi:MAG: hypothetical protein COV36_02530 [Alphaproteobacteria bacterium CG11_big_fil_rev_8_21_14_0_20_44_7]|nr:MAG: hypothetical protein COV36_02530 [Alphaproteobacteria bacterium CG11_big_fil_rev_8_21_14_0_20_44_7]
MPAVKFKTSSSFRLAGFFAILLVVSAGIILYLISLANDASLAESDIEEIRDIINALGISIIILLSIVLAVAYFVSVYVVDLINTISHTADGIMQSGDLSQRIPVRHERDDLSKLAKVLNKMFDRIEESVEGVRQVSDNIAHDLRTPITRLRTKLEKFDGTENQKEKLIKEADTIITMFNSLLRIARIESGKEKAKFKKLDLKLLLEDVVEFYEPLAEKKKQKLELSISKAEIKGDRNLLFQAFANLLDNAIKFTPANGEINISLRRSADGFTVKIADSGVGIAKQDREKVFNRFYRTESSRNTEGHGLGLSMVKAIIDYHNGKISLKDNKPGLLVSLRLQN